MYNYLATVTAAHDGDTITATVDLGFRFTFENKFRLHGINAPELSGPEAPVAAQARSFVRERILGKVIRLETFKDATEKYGRYLAKVYYTNASGQEICLNDELVANNLAKVYLP